MDLLLLNKILHVLPDDMIWEVASYFILEIPKSDKRMIILNQFLMRRNQNIREGFYRDGMFRYHIFNDFRFYFSIHCCPGMFVEYVVCEYLRTKKQRNTRIWMDGKVEDHIDSCWTIRIC